MQNPLHALVRLIRDRGETIVYFESNAVVHNSTSNDILLASYDPRNKKKIVGTKKVVAG
jgi:hypothetical protein